MTEKKKNSYVKSPLNYTGGKYKLLPQLLPLFPQNIGTFVDLFADGANVAVNIEAEHIIANDIEKRIIDIYRTFKKYDIETLIKTIEDYISDYGLTIDNAEAYNRFRDNYNKERLPIMLFVLICYSFNHQFRFNSKGEFNMPFGKERSRWNDTMKQNLINFHKAIVDKDIIFTDVHFSFSNGSLYGKNDFVYCDPPYLITCASYNERGGWNEVEEIRLLNFLDYLNLAGVKFGLSNVLSNKAKNK